MATDATGAPTPQGIPKYNTAVDVPSGKGFNAAMDAIDTLLTSHTLPSGVIMQYAGGSAPGGWLLCDGTTYNQADYAALYAAIGTTWGAGGAGTFKVPDVRGRTIVGAGSGAGLTPRALAATGGEENHLLTTAELAAHTHTEGVRTLLAVDGFQHYVGPGYTQFYPPDGTTTTVSSGSTGGGTTHNNMQPWAAITMIIKT